jgi:hypothetical protein
MLVTKKPRPAIRSVEGWAVGVLLETGARFQQPSLDKRVSLLSERAAMRGTLFYKFTSRRCH